MRTPSHRIAGGPGFAAAGGFVSGRLFLYDSIDPGHAVGSVPLQFAICRAGDGVVPCIAVLLHLDLIRCIGYFSQRQDCVVLAFLRMGLTQNREGQFIGPCAEGVAEVIPDLVKLEGDRLTGVVRLVVEGGRHCHIVSCAAPSLVLVEGDVVPD